MHIRITRGFFCVYVHNSVGSQTMTYPNSNKAENPYCKVLWNSSSIGEELCG